MEKNIRSSLCLRGGGADQKRKEARKRKFAHKEDDQLQTLIDPGLGVMDALAEQRPSKKQKPELQSSQPRSNDHTEQAHQTDDGAEYDSKHVSAAIIENGPDGHEAQNGTDQPQRAQRFIVFIGISSSYLGRLSRGFDDIIFSRQPTLYINYGFYNCAFQESAAQLNPSSHQQTNRPIERFCIPRICRV